MWFFVVLNGFLGCETCENFSDELPMHLGCRSDAWGCGQPLPKHKTQNNTGAICDYFEKLIPTSKDILLHELMGPKVGANVSQSSSLLTEHT